MIGVHTSELLRPFAEEFFQLFKTPWEFYCVEHSYEVLLCCGAEPASYRAQLVVIYLGKEEQDHGPVAGVIGRHGNTRVEAAFIAHKEDRIPIYTNRGEFYQDVILSIDIRSRSADEEATAVAHIGYNLFREIAFLLEEGQPAENAAIPAVELHISLLRDLILQHTQYLIEIPAQPSGYSMIACLTHDVDHPSLRKSRLWPTALGFFYRATLGSIVDLFRGRRKFSQLLANLRAAVSLPLIYAGLTRDIWDSFGAYGEIEKAKPSTYFFIPTKGVAGKNRDGVEYSKRASAYAVEELSLAVGLLQREGREIGVHGVNSWRDVSSGRKEQLAISKLTGEARLGVRMHWLYIDEYAPAKLEQAGYEYDSTVGYNDTVGFRAGTTQAFKFSGTSALMELPLHVMDTALFYRSHLDFKPKQAIGRISEIISITKRFGGVLTINWHDRSLAPERLWGGVYRDTVDQLAQAGAWFAICRDAVRWFRQRRDIEFENVTVDASHAFCFSVRCPAGSGEMPSPRLRVHFGKNAQGGVQEHLRFKDYEVREGVQEFRVPMGSCQLNEVCA